MGKVSSILQVAFYSISQVAVLQAPGLFLEVAWSLEVRDWRRVPLVGHPARVEANRDVDIVGQVETWKLDKGAAVEHDDKWRERVIGQWRYERQDNAIVFASGMGTWDKDWFGRALARV